MAPYDEWNKLDEEEEEELQDASFFEGKKDVILFAIDCSESMHELRDDPVYEDVKTSHLHAALDAATQIQKKKCIVGPNDSVGIMLFNTTRRNDTSGQGADIKMNNFIYQPVAPISAPKVKELIQLVDEARENPELLREAFPPLTDKRVPMGDVFTSCNWIMRDGAPKTATKRVFLITDEDNPHPGTGRDRLVTSARTTLIDLSQAGIMVEPFFISTEEKPFDVNKFYSSVLLPSSFSEDDETDASVLPESISISRMEDLLSQMRFHEVPKRAHFSIPFELASGFAIGVKGYGLVTEQKKGQPKFFVDLGDRLELATSRTTQVDEERQTEIDKPRIMYGMTLGAHVASADAAIDASEDDSGPTRAVRAGSRVFYTEDEMKSFRTFGLEPKIKLLGFKNRKALAFEDNVKHSLFIYPDEMTYSGSKRTFSALLKTMIKKKKIGLALALPRRNSTPMFYALLPQAEKAEEDGWHEPSGFHLIPLPFADDIRAAPENLAQPKAGEEPARAPEELANKAREWVEKLSFKKGGYPPDSYPNPALALHNAQLEAHAFREEFDEAEFEDLTLPNYKAFQKRAGESIQEWNKALSRDKSAQQVTMVTTGSRKRPADTSVDEIELKTKFENGQLAKLRVNQLKAFCEKYDLSTSGLKADLINRLGQYLEKQNK